MSATQKHKVQYLKKLSPRTKVAKIDEYLEIASDLKPQLEKIDGFISIERCSSLIEEEKILSLSFWRDEEAINKWPNLETHSLAQEKGRTGVFSNYRLRVAVKRIPKLGR